jgi:hypothetical protein
MNKLFYIVFSVLILFSLGCKEEEIVINVEELPDDKKSFIVGDSILLKGENLHEVNKVFLEIENGETISAGFKSIASTYDQNHDLQEDELLLYIPETSILLGKRVELILGREIDDPKNGTFYQEEKTGMFFEILAPEIRSVSRHEFNDKEPSYIVLDNFKLKSNYSIDIIQFREVEDPNGKILYYYSRPEVTIISDDSIKLETSRRNGPVFLCFGWEGDNTGSTYNNLTDVKANLILKTDSMKMYNSYTLPVDQLYAPGSFMLITGEHTNKLNSFSEAKVGGYPARKGFDWPGEIGMVMPTTIPFSDGDKFEMVLPKESGYLNFDNSHNYLEFVEGKFRIVDEAQEYMNVETNVYYRTQFLNYAIVTTQNDTLWYNSLSATDYETSSGVNFGIKLEKPTLSQGTYQLLIYSDDRKYQLKPAGNISFSVK